MTAYVIGTNGKWHQLENLLEWQFDYSMGVPCDSFRVVCLWDGSNENPIQWREFAAYEDGVSVFRGVVDECETSLTHQGMKMELCGRNMAALLLDNEAVGRDYETATTRDILKDHVTCFGVKVGHYGSFAPVSPFPVGTGESAWSVVYNFFYYNGGVLPYFDLDGRLQLIKRPEKKTLVVDDDVAVTALKCRDQRYGVISQIFVRNVASQRMITMENPEFYPMGGRCRRVVTIGEDDFIYSARHSGAFQMEKSNGDLLRLEVTVAEGFYAFPGQLVSLERTGWGRNGRYRVVASRVTMDGDGFVTRLELAHPDILI